MAPTDTEAVHVRAHIDESIPKQSTAREDLFQFQTGRQGFVKDLSDIGIFCLENIQQFFHNHELVPGHEKYEISRFNEFQVVQIILSVGRDDRIAGKVSPCTHCVLLSLMNNAVAQSGNPGCGQNRSRTRPGIRDSHCHKLQLFRRDVPAQLTLVSGQPFHINSAKSTSFELNGSP